MGALATPRLMGWKTALKLGRVSNLPTVWSNVIAAFALTGGAPLRVVVTAAVAMSLLYVGGMYLNDAFDRDIDASERANRPIPSGEASANAVFAAGFAALAAGVVLLAVQSPRSGLVGLILAGAIVLYDWHHKGNPLSPACMALCRLLAYLTAGLAVTAHPPAALLLAALAGFAHIVGLTYAAKQENLAELGHLWPLAFLALPLLYGIYLAAGSLAGLLLWLGLLGCAAFALHVVIALLAIEVVRASRTRLQVVRR